MCRAGVVCGGGAQARGLLPGRAVGGQPVRPEVPLKEADEVKGGGVEGPPRGKEKERSYRLAESKKIYHQISPR
jgi:hypothetical protein